MEGGSAASIALPKVRRITNRYRRTNSDMDVSEFAAHVLPVLRTKAVGGLCQLATTSDILVFHFQPDLPLIGISVIRHAAATFATPPTGAEHSAETDTSNSNADYPERPRLP